MTRAAAIIALLTILFTGTYGDAIISTNQDHTIVSQNGDYFADISAKQHKIKIYKTKSNTVIWEIKTILSQGIISNNGDRVAVFGPHLNLLPWDVCPDEIIIVIFHQNGQEKQIRLRDVVQTKEDLVKTESHYALGVLSGFDGDSVILELSNGRKIKIDSR